MKPNTCPICNKKILPNHHILPSLLYENIYYHQKCVHKQTKKLLGNIPLSHFSPNQQLISSIRNIRTTSGQILSSKIPAPPKK